MESLDLQLIEKQLGRRPRGVVGVGLRCPAGYPRVIVTKPVVEPGQVFPTTYWLTCPHLVKEVSRLESQGLVGNLRNGRSMMRTLPGNWWKPMKNTKPHDKHC